MTNSSKSFSSMHEKTRGFRKNDQCVRDHIAWCVEEF